MLYPVELRAPYEVEYHQMAQEIGRGREIRTPDILLPKQARYQTALYPEFRNGRELHRKRRSGIILRCFEMVKPCWPVL